MPTIKAEAKKLLSTFHYTGQFWLGYDHDRELGYLAVKVGNIGNDVDEPEVPAYECIPNILYSQLIGIDSSEQRGDLQYEEYLVEGKDLKQALRRLAK